MLRCQRHDREHPVDELVWHVFMEQVTEAIDEDPPPLPPVQGLQEPVRVQDDAGCPMLKLPVVDAEGRRPLDVAVGAYDSPARLWYSR